MCVYVLYKCVYFLIQDIVSRHISESDEKEGENVKSVNSGTWVASNSELTPSESLATTDDVSQYDVLNVDLLSVYNKQKLKLDHIVDIEL